MTFLLGGLWHGAAWTFVIWGAMHGAALVVHRLWSRAGRQMVRPLAWLLTFAFVDLAWVVFRAKDMDCLRRFMDAFSGKNGIAMGMEFIHKAKNIFIIPDIIVVSCLIFILLVICFVGMNSREILVRKDVKIVRLFFMLLCSISLICICVPDKSQEFIYFQF